MLVELNSNLTLTDYPLLDQGESISLSNLRNSSHDSLNVQSIHTVKDQMKSENSVFRALVDRLPGSFDVESHVAKT